MNAVTPRGARQGRHSGLVSTLVLGALCGLAWAAGFRGMMSEIAGKDSGVDGVLTFVWLLLPGIVVGALLAWAEHIRRTGGRRRWRWLALSPLVKRWMHLDTLRDTRDLAGRPELGEPQAAGANLSGEVKA